VRGREEFEPPQSVGGGPDSGVSISAPKLLQPAGGASLDSTKQPLTLMIANATTNGVRPLSYSVEVALDANFGNKVYSREGIPPGGDGRTSLRLSDALAADRTYYWRARAQDGANTGPYTPAVSFTVYTPIILEAPVLAAPAHNARLTTRTPTFVITNSRRSGPAGPVTYTLQIARDHVFGSVVTSIDLPETLPNTKKTYTGTLANDKKYYWRVRAREGSSRNVVGPWSETRAFITPAAAPTTPPGDGGGGGGGPLPAPPYSTDGRDVVRRVSDAYPSYLAAGVSLERRRANMAFLRDKVIEQGLCGGMRLGWNWKRGKVGDKSYDYVTYYTGGRWIGVDIGAAYDDTSRPLRLVWNENPGDSYATYAGYSPTPACR